MVINRHTKAKQEVKQTGSGVLTGEQQITQHVQQTSAKAQNVPIKYIEDAKGIRAMAIYKYGWQNQNKQWEAAYRQLQAWREEDSEYANEAQQQLSYLQHFSGR